MRGENQKSGGEWRKDFSISRCSVHLFCILCLHESKDKGSFYKPKIKYIFYISVELAILLFLFFFFSPALWLWRLQQKAFSCSGRELSGGVYSIPTGVHLTHHIWGRALYLPVQGWEEKNEETAKYMLSSSFPPALMGSHVFPFLLISVVWFRFSSAVYSTFQSTDVLQVIKRLSELNVETRVLKAAWMKRGTFYHSDLEGKEDTYI